MSSCLIFEAHTLQFIFHGVIIDFTETDTSRNTNVSHKENIWVKEQGEYDDVKCHNLCVYCVSCWGGGDGEG